MIIDFENIHVSYYEKLILKELNLKIQKGEHWAILGKNGSGKSTLIKLISSEIHPRKQFIYKKEIMGKERYTLTELKMQLGIITNDLHNYFEKEGNFLTTYEVVLSGYYSSIGVFSHQDFTSDQHERALEVLEFLGLEEIKEKKVHELSTGQLRKAIIGRALIHKPKAFILDEPTVGLDIKAQVSFINTMKKLSREATIILVTHHIEEIFEEISNIALMYENTVYIQGAKNEVLTSENLSKIFEVELSIQEKNGRYFFDRVG
jgi:iron complex transport system ATP-binding protein